MIRQRNTSLRRSIRPSLRRRLWLQALEDRAVPALFTVNLTGDAGLADPMDVSKGDLRYCIDQANLTAGDDTIVFDAAISSVNLNSQLSIIDPAGLIIDGNGLVTITNVAMAGPTSRLFDITAATSIEIEFRGLTLTGGNVNVGAGGAIQAANTNLRLTDCVFNGNKAATGAGGAVATLTASTVLNISDCTFTNNAAATTGGALQVVGATSTITIDGTLFSGNSNTGTTGGAINVQGTSTLNIGVTSGCTFTNNSAKTNGGALNTAGSTTATINNSTFSGNTTSGTGTGGGINFNTTANVSFTNSKLQNNTAGGAGGGIRFVSSATTVTFNTCSISGNVSNATSGGGGGVSMSSGQFKAYYSTFSGNTAAVSGGGLYATAATITFTNCTISGNEARGSSTVANGGGGINLSTGQLNINNSTIASNRVSGSATTSIGGGIRKSSATSTVTINSSVIANNSAASGVGAEVGGSVAINVNGNNNLLGTGSNQNFNFINGPVIADPRFAPLGNYGGPTETYGLRYTSPLIDQGNLVNIGFFTNDQRGSGFPRTVDNPSVIDGLGGPTDIGAVEGNLTIPWADSTTIVPDVNTPNMDPIVFTVVYDDETGINPASLNIGEIKVSGPGGFLNLIPTLTGAMAGPGPNQTSATYSFNPPAGGWQLIHGGTYTINLLPNKVFDNDMPTSQSAAAQLLGSFHVSLPGSVSLVVDNASDVVDGNYGTGQLTLREAMNLANAATGGADTIAFAPALNGQTITLTQGEFAINGAMQINGPGAALLTIDANNASRIFNINDETPTAIDVAIRGLTLTRGRAAGGGAILMAPESLLLEQMVLTANNSTSLGGALRFSTTGGNNLTINNSTFSDNSATSNGGAIGTNGGTNTITINNSNFSNNKSSTNGGAMDTGGGGGALNVTNSSFTGNMATSNGGAISAGYAVFDFKNCTLSGNTAGGLGGASSGYNNYQKFTNCTIVNNVAGTGGGAISVNKSTGTQARILLTSSTVVENRTTSGNGGGLRLNTSESGATVFLRVINSIVSDNGIGASLPGTPSDLYRGGTAPANEADINFSAIGTTTGVTLSGASGDNLVGAIIDLGPLQDNGGPTHTRLPNPGSPVIDAGSNAVAMLSKDQRGLARPIDQPMVTNIADGTDIGAVEVQLPVATLPTVSTITINNGDMQRSLVTTIKVTFSETVTFPSGIADAFVVERTALGTPTGSVAFDAVQSGADVVITFKAGGTVGVDPGNSLQDGQYKLTIVSDNVLGIGGGKLDGNGDMIEQGSPTDDELAMFHRLFGDSNGDGAVNATDFNAFRLVYGGGSSIFDFDNDGNTTAADFNAFRVRYGLTGYLP